ncbi:restriction endonuclease subunit S [Methylobacterium sp. WL9]|uniref:restriction endonuclease subunit S n=1 Tax=Methylobacterium sp. WL9 TaxID=2603898 RepID=UPI0011C6F209|nr:restriction endonuclease subunit S [Methylobacterium sp. WL9]TXN25129.1 restriction endonuclease subunit S [Methylobacterium sp. WL9]
MSSKGTFTTAKDGEPAPSPNLRFPEFQDANGWHVTKLNSLLFEAKHRNRSLELGPADVLSVSGEYGCVNQIEFMGRSYAGVTVKDYHVVEHGDIVYTKSPLKKNPYGIIKKNKGKRGIVSTLYAVYRPTPDCCPAYLDHFFSVDFHLNSYLQPIVRKGAKNDMKVNNADVLKGDICVPDLPEQQKIAECLDSADALIEAQGRKVEALGAHKKGLMQQLFTQEAETQPRLRFPEFRDAEGWEVKRVDERGSVLAGKALAVNALGPQRPYLRTKNVLDGAIDLSDVLTMPMTDAEFDRFEILDGDILLNEGQSLELVGRAAMYRDEFDGRCAMQNQLLRFRAYPSTCREFAAQAFRKCQKDGTFANVATKTTSVAHLGSSRFNSLELAWPALLAEQQRVADCLNSLDGLIATEAQKLDALKTHKKGLMQRLFPRVGEA